MSTQPTVENPTLPDGTKNPKYVDLLDEDPPVAGQKFVCLSFISPEHILKKRELFLFEKFAARWEMAKSMEKFQDFINFISYKYSQDSAKLMQDYADFIAEEDKKLKEDAMAFENDYRAFLEKHEERLNLEFSRENQFQTSVRGIKVRGVFSTQEEAEMHSKKLRERDPHHDIFVGQVGSWMPYHPDAYKTGKIDFMEPELNKLYQEKIANEDKAKQLFEERVKEAKRKAIRENIEKAKASGNKLTQTIDEQGNLVGTNTMNFEDREVADAKERDDYNQAIFDKANNV
jgi:Family of unknown function (DUF5832)